MSNLIKNTGFIFINFDGNVLAVHHCYNWVAMNENNIITAFKDKPKISEDRWMVEKSEDGHLWVEGLTHYEGDLNWKKSLLEVKKNIINLKPQRYDITYDAFNEDSNGDWVKHEDLIGE